MEYKYCVLKSSWGIVVFLDAEFVEYVKNSSHEKVLQVTDGIWLEYRQKYQNAYHADLPYLKQGILLVQGQIRLHSNYKDTLIVIQSVEFNECHFQAEGLTAAIIEWAAKAFDFDCPEIPVEYDRENRRYVYDFDAIRFVSEQDG